MSKGMVMVDWNDETSGELQRLYRRGLSFTEIANTMGVSRNAAIGKAHRMQLPARQIDVPTEVGKAAKVRLHRIRTVQAEVAAPPARPPPIVLDDVDYTCPIYELSNATCRWPMWQFDTPHEQRFYCGHPSADFYSGRPYCLRHSRLCGSQRQ